MRTFLPLFNNIESIKSSLKHDTATEIPTQDNGGYDALKALGELEAQTLITGLLDTGKQRIKELLTKLTNTTTTNTQRGKGESAVNESIRALKAAGYYIEEKDAGSGSISR